MYTSTYYYTTTPISEMNFKVMLNQILYIFLKKV